MTIFVFGSNLAGKHGRGAARYAFQHYAARYGDGEGRTGSAYAIPTKDEKLQSRPLGAIRLSVDKFIAYARANPHLTFEVTPIGTGYAGFKHAQIAPMFKDAPKNCQLPVQWNEWVGQRKC